VRRRRAAASWAGLLLAAAAASAAEPALEVSLEPRRFGIEDVARLEIRITEPEGSPVVDLGPLSNLEVASGPSTGTEFSWVNGVATRATTFTYLVQGVEVGPASVGPVVATIGGIELRTEAVAAEVVPGSVAPQRPQGGRPPVAVDPFGEFFQRRQPGRAARVELRQIVDRRQAVLGQPVTAVVVLDTTSGGVDGFEWVSPPAYPGWWTQRVDPPQRISSEVVEIDGVRFNRFEVARHVLVPLKTGELELPEASARIGLRASSLFAPQQVLERSTGVVPVRIAPRPRPPEGFSGAVGELRYRASLDPETIAFGEPAVLSIELSGNGNLPLVEAPALWPRCEPCESYPPEEESEVTIDGRGIHGRRVWRTTLVPRSSGAIEIEPVVLAVFDPASGAYRQQTLGPLRLEVEAPPVAAEAASEPASAESAAGPAEPEAPPADGPDSGPPPWLLIGGALLVGLVAGGLVTLAAARRRRVALPPRAAGQSPAERARELQVALERWWLDARGSAKAEALEERMRGLRRDLEAVRFAPGRADHSETVAELEERLRSLMRLA
jgi:hypothetical protein